MVDPRAVLITKGFLKEEANEPQYAAIRSTLSGTGAALSARVARRDGLQFAGSRNELKPYIGDTAFFLNSELEKGSGVLLEGTQGYGLSNLLSKEFPYCTSIDTTAASFLSLAGIAPCHLAGVIGVCRTYPIRVGGTSGPLKDEVSWDYVTRQSGSKEHIEEYTTVTHTLRRVAKFDGGMVKEACRVNGVTDLVVNFMDYVDASAGGAFPSDVQLRWLEDNVVPLGVRTIYISGSPYAVRQFREGVSSPPADFCHV